MISVTLSEIGTKGYTVFLRMYGSMKKPLLGWSGDYGCPDCLEITLEGEVSAFLFYHDFVI